MHISTRHISPEQPPYVIAELGVNHDGSVERALEMIDAAAGAGADAVKFQFFKAEMLMSRASRLAAYQSAAGESDPVEMLRRLEFTIEQLEACLKRAHERKIHAIVTVFSLPLVEQAQKLAWDAFKTASPDIIHRPLLEALAATGRPLILSTGASTLDEVRRAAGWLESSGDRLAVLQCVSSYPTPMEDAELAGISALHHALHLPTGYSDHTATVQTGMTAAAMGALLLEKHFTYSQQAQGPDHAASLEPTAFAQYVQGARQGWQAAKASRCRATASCPNPEAIKRVLAIEQDVRTVSRQSIIATRDLPAGHVLTAGDVCYKRPGTGLPPYEVAGILGKTLARAVAADMPVMAGDVGR